MLQLNFVSTWGDPYYMGLTGLELLGANQEAIPLSYNMLKVRPEVCVQQEQGSCSGEFVVGSRLAARVFLRVVRSSSRGPKIQHFQILTPPG